jgi:alkylation response protein AidB-like acyl-CoA dehydrogenase
MSTPSAFPLHDPVGSDSAEQPDVEALGHLLVPLAADADRRGVQRESMDRLAAAGFLGSPLTPPGVQRELGELISGIDATTWFCWVQHQSPLRALERAVWSKQAPHAEALRERLLPGLRSGSLVSAVAFAHVRRPGPANPRATRADGGWVLDGTLDWVTSWDIADVVMVMAQGVGADTGSLISMFLPAGRSHRKLVGLEMDLPLSLLAMSGTHTRPVHLTSAFVPIEEVVEVVDRDEWLRQDAILSANSSPAAFGVARGAIAELSSFAAQRGDDRIDALASALGDECRTVRRAAYAAIDDPSASVPVRLRLRAASLDLVVRATTAVVVARAGAAMRSGQDAERRVREAMFLQVQAQTASSRAASLDVLIDASLAARERVLG